MNNSIDHFNNPPVLGLRQLKGRNKTLESLHDPKTGWPIRTPPAPADIWLQDDLTFRDGKVLEIEKYISHYKEDISKIVFYVWHKNLKEFYPNLNFIYYPRFHYEQQSQLKTLDVPNKFTFNND